MTMDKPMPAPLAPGSDPLNSPCDEVEERSTPVVAEPLRPTVSPFWHHWIDGTLHFLSHASNETLGACLVGLGTTTYLVLGRVGLIMIGVAGGVVLHATWEGVRHAGGGTQTQEEEQERRRETGLQLARRLLDWRFDQVSREDPKDARIYVDQKLDFSAFEPETRSALESFTNAVVKDYVYYWYGPTIPGEESFPASCKSTLTAYILSLSGHLQRKRPADVFLDFVTNASSIIIVFLNELAAATNASPQSSPEDAIATYLKLKPESSLSYILDIESQSRKLADLSEDILQAYLDPKSYNCLPVHIFLKEILAHLVLGYTILLCSKSEWINEWIVYGLEESETASKVMDIVDAGVEGLDTAPVSHRNEQDPFSDPGVESNKQAAVLVQNHSGEHRRHMSKAEEAMDEAMREAKRLTELMIEEDEKRARQGLGTSGNVNGSEDVSDVGTSKDTPTPAIFSDSDPKQRHNHKELNDISVQTLEVNTEDHVSGTGSTRAYNEPQSTSFDQIHPSQLASSSTGAAERGYSPLTLHNASISIFDDSLPRERTSIKAKPTTDYLIQIEPSNSVYPGWMISRKYGDFEMLHEVLRRISVITGVTGFAEGHSTLPLWKGNTKAVLRTELEQYLMDAAKFQPLAESEGMKRFLERDRGLNKSPTGKGFGWPTPDGFGRLGGDVVNALTKAPKNVAGGVAGGGKAVLGGVAGLVGAGKKTAPGLSTSVTSLSEASSPGTEAQSVISTPPTSEVYIDSARVPGQSQDSLGGNIIARPDLSRQISTDAVASVDSKPAMMPVQSEVDTRESVESLHDTHSNEALDTVPFQRNDEESFSKDEEVLILPPPPSEMPADYDSYKGTLRTSSEAAQSTIVHTDLTERSPPSHPLKTQSRSPKAPLTERETSVAVELMFAVISELYTLSSAWNFRRTLLTAAKTFLLRPGNPQLAAIRDLLQNSLIDANLSDAGLAGHILKLRENALPTEVELEDWKRDYPEKTLEQKEELRVRARKLLVNKGMPQALTSVMGAAASGEALGKVFDCLQVESVSRGLVFGLMLQALRVVTH